jgi:hypothetical protein
MWRLQMPYIRRKPQKILVGIDGSNSSMRAADYAISIACKNNSQNDNNARILL